MGLFSSKSKSSSKSTTTYTDNSKKMSVDLSKGDSVAGGDSGQYLVAGGNVNYHYDGLSDNLATQIFGVMSDTFNASLNWVEKAIKSTNDQQADILKQQADNQKAVMQQTTQALQTAYNSEQATITGFKSYALYAMFAFVAWAYFGRKH